MSAFLCLFILHLGAKIFSAGTHLQLYDGSLWENRLHLSEFLIMDTFSGIYLFCYVGNTCICLKVHLVLLCFREWPASAAVDLLNLVAHDTKLSYHFQDLARKRAEQIKVYEKVKCLVIL